MAERIFPADTKTIKVVVLCLIAATTFWFFNALNDDYSATIYYPIRFDYDQNEYIATQKVPEEIQVNVSGGGWLILRQGYLLDAEPINLPLQNPDRSDKISGNSLFGPLSEGLSDLELNYVLDDTLYLSIEKKISKRVKLLVDSAGVDLSKDHYIVSAVRCNSDSVEIKGPESMIKSYPDTIWIRIPDGRVDTNFDMDVQIDPISDLISLSKSIARVTFDVEEFVTVSKRIVLTKWNFPSDSSLTLADSAIELRFKIGEGRVSQLENDEFLIVVDFKRMVTYDSTIQALIMKYPMDIKGLTLGTSRAKVIRVVR